MVAYLSEYLLKLPPSPPSPPPESIFYGNLKTFSNSLPGIEKYFRFSGESNIDFRFLPTSIFKIPSPGTWKTFQTHGKKIKSVFILRGSENCMGAWEIWKQTSTSSLISKSALDPYHPPIFPSQLSYTSPSPKVFISNLQYLTKLFWLKKNEEQKHQLVTWWSELPFSEHKQAEQKQTCFGSSLITTDMVEHTYK